jgi:ubiquinone/menaquinone biosynthesis C-methylase UbiE
MVKALSYVAHKDAAIDLGSGALNDVTHLLEAGFKQVIAVDKKPVALEIARSLPSDRFEYVISPLESFEFPTDSFDLVNAQYSLPFIAPHEFESVFHNITASLKDGGIFTGQFFGDRDEWSSNTAMTFHTKEQAIRLLSSFETLSFEEEEQDKRTAAGEMKHWHVFHFIVRHRDLE